MRQLRGWIQRELHACETRTTSPVEVARGRLPLYGPIEAAIAGRTPDLIEIAVVPTRAAEQTYAIETAGFQRYTRALLHPFILSCFERYRAARLR